MLVSRWAEPALAVTFLGKENVGGAMLGLREDLLNHTGVVYEYIEIFCYVTTLNNLFFLFSPCFSVLSDFQQSERKTSVSSSRLTVSRHVMETACFVSAPLVVAHKTY